MTQSIVRTNFDREESRPDRRQSVSPIFPRIAKRDGDYDFDAHDRALTRRLNRSRR
jgi:hypothetical protein